MDFSRLMTYAVNHISADTITEWRCIEIWHISPETITTALSTSRRTIESECRIEIELSHESRRHLEQRKSLFETKELCRVTFLKLKIGFPSITQSCETLLACLTETFYNHFMLHKKAFPLDTKSHPTSWGFRNVYFVSHWHAQMWFCVVFFLTKQFQAKFIFSPPQTNFIVRYPRNAPFRSQIQLPVHPRCSNNIRV